MNHNWQPHEKFPHLFRCEHCLRVSSIAEQETQCGERFTIRNTTDLAASYAVIIDELRAKISAIETYCRQYAHAGSNAGTHEALKRVLDIIEREHSR